MMMDIVILGTGNLAHHLFDAFMTAKEVSIIQVVGRSQQGLEYFKRYVDVTCDYNAITEADIYIIAVKDDSIGQVSQHLSSLQGLVVHTSGAKDMDAIVSYDKGVFYPLQTFTQGRPVDFKEIPICVEAENQESLKQLKKLASTISQHVQEINSDQRKKLHLAAVFANNFTNYLYGVGENLCVSEGLSFDMLKPLIRETAEKVQSLTPFLAQTGPAKRGDQKSMQAHLDLLTKEDHKKLYIQLSESIQKVYEKEL